ncbi:MAG: ketol-acid reductoisomerase [candidate division Zixibacteria bacterium]|nr:ketol-acid reductoisomerase [candidate division Zixibacteria bacterium]
MRKNGNLIKNVAILGYGSQGRAIALNLRDSGYEVIVGLKSRSRSRSTAKADGMTAIYTFPDAVRKGSVICFAFPDHLHGRIYREQIADYIVPGSSLLFLHGLSLHFGLIKPPTGCDVILLAPHAPGVAVREKYLSDRSISAFYAIHQNSSGKARKTIFELAQAVGFQKKRLVATTFEHEALGDLFGEQAVLCGGLAMLIKTGFEVLIEKGIPSENAYLEVAYQLDLIVDLIRKHGIEGMFERISVAARFGSLLSGPKIIGNPAKKQMKKAFDYIESGSFAKRLDNLTQSEVTGLRKALKALSHPDLEKTANKYSTSRK